MLVLLEPEPVLGAAGSHGGAAAAGQSPGLGCAWALALAPALMCLPNCALRGARRRLAAGRAAAPQDPLSPKTSSVFSFKVVLATPRRCCRLPWTSGLRVLSTTDVSFSPLIPPLGPKRVQALPARISVNRLLSQCVAQLCRANVTPDALPACAKQPGLVGELSPLPAPREGPAASRESPSLARRCAEMAAQPL